MTVPTQATIAQARVSADTLTPVTAALRLGHRLAFLLESVEGGVRYGRFSFVGVHGRTLVVRGTDASLRDASGAALDRFSADDPLQALDAVLPDAPPAAADVPYPLASGVGYLAYEVTARWEPVAVPAADPLAMPDAVLHLPSAVIVFDHLAQEARVVAVDGPGAAATLDEIVETISTPSAREAPRRLGTTSPAQPAVEDPRRAAYEAHVARLVEEIRDGEMLQAVLARRFSSPIEEPPFEAYRSLRRINPSPYLFFVDLDPVDGAAGGGSRTALLGASPELLVRVRDGEVVTRPIAGTRPRHDDPLEDARLEAELSEDEKELAEHAMLVDLARNDVGRVAAGGTVSVPTLREVERYSHVMHLVSEVRGRLREGLDAFDAVRATFPAGTVSGAPKVRAMQAIAELEGERRGPYGGAVGYFGRDDTECAITIRSILVRGGTAHVHAGAGIVADSVPEHEGNEVAAKAGAMLAALAAMEPQP